MTSMVSTAPDSSWASPSRRPSDLGKIVPQEDVDANPLLGFDQRDIVRLGHEHADGAAHLVTWILVDHRIDGTADQCLAVAVAEVMGNQDDVARSSGGF